MERIPPISWKKELLYTSLAILLSLIVSAGLISLADASALVAAQAIVEGAFGGTRKILETFVQATPLVFTGLAMTIAFRGRVWNIGAEGQYVAGAMAAMWIGLLFPSISSTLGIPLVLIASALAGALLGALAGFIKIRFETDEIIVTVMLNFIIMALLSYLLTGPWRDPGSFYLHSPLMPEGARLPRMLAGGRLHYGFLLGLALVLLMDGVLKKTPFGYRIRAVGANPKAAEYKGINLDWMIVSIFALSGAIAGLGGGGELAGVTFRLRLDVAIGFGYTGIIIALLARLNPIGVVLVAVLFGAMVNGSTELQIATGVPVALVHAMQAIILLCTLAAGTFTHYRLRIERDVE